MERYCIHRITEMHLFLLLSEVFLPLITIIKIYCYLYRLKRSKARVMIRAGQIFNCIKAQSGLTFVHEDIEDATIVNLGSVLAEELSKIDLNISCLPMMAEEILCDILDKSIIESDGKGILVVNNINILFEKQLALDVASILHRSSRNCLVVIQTDGEVRGNTFFPFGIRNDICIKLDNIPFFEI